MSEKKLIVTAITYRIVMVHEEGVKLPSNPEFEIEDLIENDEKPDNEGWENVVVKEVGISPTQRLASKEEADHYRIGMMEQEEINLPLGYRGRFRF